MCKYCENEEIIFKEEVISRASWGWGGDLKIKESETSFDTLELFIEKRDISGESIPYLRLVPDDDNQCIEAGQKIQINFCPFCGKKLK